MPKCLYLLVTLTLRQEERFLKRNLMIKIENSYFFIIFCICLFRIKFNEVKCVFLSSNLIRKLITA